jgi:hypothetical protein
MHVFTPEGYEGKVFVSATCRRSIGTLRSGPSAESETKTRSFPVMPPAAPILQDP